MSVESRTRAGQPAGQTCQQCRGDLEQDDPRDGGSDPTTTHEGYRCPECGAAGALVVRDGVVIRTVGPACDAAFGRDQS